MVTPNMLIKFSKKKIKWFLFVCLFVFMKKNHYMFTILYCRLPAAITPRVKRNNPKYITTTATYVRTVSSHHAYLYQRIY